MSIDFSMARATLVTEYDPDYGTTARRLSLLMVAGPVEYMAVRFPADDFPANFNRLFGHFFQLGRKYGVAADFPDHR